ncbi:hypothetical protein AAD018_012030 [Aestuariibius insulae]|uniref:hypothetical protein n=1 Tax=Aestuariibius insulae TaxID=2058287 RepID=UPI00345F0D32
MEGLTEALAREIASLRLAMGWDAVDAIRDHAQSVLAELSVWESVARDIPIDASKTIAAE